LADVTFLSVIEHCMFDIVS